MRRCLIIAEAGVNHDGDAAAAQEMVRVAAAADADVIKFQTFVADRLVCSEAPKARYQVETTGCEGSQLEMLRALELSREDHVALAEASTSAGIEFLSTPFDEQSADQLEQIGVQRFKIPSGEVSNHPLLRHIAGKGKPILLSTGMCWLGEVEAAIRVLEDAGVSDLTVLHCTSSYPAEPAECNLRALETLRSAFGFPVGYSDHTLGVDIACAAVALGATVIEKHFTLDRRRQGPDHRASLEPAELAELVRAVRRVEVALGDGRKRPTSGELDTRRVARRSLVAARDLEPGAMLRSEDLCSMRPGTGISPAERDRIIGHRLRKPVSRHQPLAWGDLG